MNYEKLRGHPPDFEVCYRMYSPEEGGRKSGPPWQHYRCDWSYEGDDVQNSGLYMIHPEFLGESGEVLPEGQAVPMSGVASMWVVVPEMRATVHRARIHAGVKGYFMEGPRRVGEAVVTRVIALGTNPSEVA